MDSNSKMFRESHPDTAHSRYSREVNEGCTERGKKLQRALSVYPFREEIVDKGSVRSDRNMLNEALRNKFDVAISRAFSNTIRYFEPYDVQPSEEHSDEDFVTQVVTFDLYDRQRDVYDEQNSPEADSCMKLLLFRLGCAAEQPREDTIGIGTNARYGAIVENDQLKPIRIDADVIREGIVARIARGSVAVEPSETTDTFMTLLHRVAMDVVELNTDDPMHAEVINEIDRFIEQCGPETSPGVG